MFTGIVEEMGVVRGIEFPSGRQSDAVVSVEGPLVTSDVRRGDSIAVDGVCLTVSGFEGDVFTADVMPESLSRTTLGGLAVGDRVDLERAMPAHGRLGGHIVQGHVDGVGRLVSRSPGERWDDLRFAADRELLRYVAEKGSIAVQGVSLTVTGVDGEGFGVSLIPTTLGATVLGALVPGSLVNLEVDVVAKYVERLMSGGSSASAVGGVV